jgi:AhpD family alkylhydroperoxidase
MPQRLRYAELAPEGLARLRAFEHYLNSATALSASLREFVRLRASLLNGCEYCIALHRHELEKHHEPLTRIDAIQQWSSSTAFTPRERAALRWTDAVTNIQQGHCSDEEFAAVTEFFDGKDLADLTLTVASINAWNRMAIPFRAEHEISPASSASSASTSSPDTSLANSSAATGEAAALVDAVGDDGGKVAEE